ncbi:MAG TPA: hypothetical protein PLU23_03285 [Anaerolineaceae bacterium]|nr:hypothetical protein [Anaerolineaceae bacterium]
MTQTNKPKEQMYRSQVCSFFTPTKWSEVLGDGLSGVAWVFGSFLSANLERGEWYLVR